MSAELFPGIAFSPRATLTNNIGAADTIIEVSDISAFPPAPNLATIGTDEEGETVLYAAKTDTALSGCRRGVEGAARAWTSGELIGRNFTAKDHADLISAVSETWTAATTAQTAATTAGNAAKDARDAAQDAQEAAEEAENKATEAAETAETAAQDAAQAKEDAQAAADAAATAQGAAETAQTEAASASSTAGTAKTAAEEAKKAVDSKQPTLTGQPGQVAGFGADGRAMAVPGWSNPNLLDNWYFPDPINQRGETAYRGNAYGIDRWRIANDSTLMTVADDCMRLSTALTGSGRSMRQAVENPDALYGKPVTFSCLARSMNSEEGLYIAIFMSSAVNGTDKVVAKSDVYYSVDDDTMISCTTTIPWPENAGNNRNITLYIGYENNKTTLNVNTADLIAAKLELGSVQTLARQDADGSWVLSDPPPNKQQELAKCQRYQLSIGPLLNVSGVAYGPDPAQASVSIPTPVTMRATPAVSNYSLYRCVQNGKIVNITGVSAMDVNPTGVRLRIIRDTNWETNYSVDMMFSSLFLDANL